MLNRVRCCAIAAFLAASALFGCGIADRAADSGAVPESGGSAQMAAPEPRKESAADVQIESSVDSGQPEQRAEPDYIGHVMRETIARFVQPGMSEYEKAKAAFDYIIETTSLAEPVGLDLWRIRGHDGAPPPFVENRSLSVMLYGIGMCEDYAAALTALLRGMGMEADYVPGLTYAANGSGLVDHAWTIAKIDGEWYHLDCQLEDNISRRDTIRYKYFMRSDAAMRESHRWGQNLIDSKLLTPEQNAEIARDFVYAPCPQDYAAPQPRTFTSAAVPDMDALKAAIDAEFREYERIHGPLEPLELNIIPPVFALEGYGPAD